MTTKTGDYSGSGKNPLSEGSLAENGDNDDKTPSYPDYAGGMKPCKKPDPNLKYSGGNDGPTDRKSWS